MSHYAESLIVSPDLDRQSERVRAHVHAMLRKLPAHARRAREAVPACAERRNEDGAGVGEAAADGAAPTCADEAARNPEQVKRAGADAARRGAPAMRRAHRESLAPAA